MSKSGVAEALARSNIHSPLELGEIVNPKMAKLIKLTTVRTLQTEVQSFEQI